MSEARYIEPFEALYSDLVETPDWRQRLRETAWSSFTATGVPTRKDEAWRWTNLRALQKGEYGLDERDPAAISVDSLPQPPLEGPRIVLVNGRLREDLSDLDRLPEGLNIAPLDASEAQILESLPFDDFPMVALNCAFGAGGVAISANRPVEEPLCLVTLTDGGETQAQSHPQILLALTENASLTLVSVDQGQGDSAYLNNTLLLAKLGKTASLKHYAVQEESAEATHITTRFVDLAQDARYESYRLNLGAAASRDEYRVNLSGEGASVTLNGAQLLREKQLGDITTFVEHAVPNATAAETFKSVIDGQAHGVFQGKILVARDAQGTDGRMMNKTLLLSEKAEIDTKPELEIYADDVECAHGATAGEIDAEALFYLRSRGLSERTARALLIRAFLSETLTAGMTLPKALEEAFLARIDAWMKEASA